jgi:hypothetical protein
MADDLRSLAHDLSEAPRRAQRDALAVVERAAVQVKNGWAANATKSSGRHAKLYPASISYDMSLGAALVGVIEATIGPDKSKPQGPLGNLLEFGSVNNPPTNDGGRALRAEAPLFELALADVTLQALGWGGIRV